MGTQTHTGNAEDANGGEYPQLLIVFGEKLHFADRILRNRIQPLPRLQANAIRTGATTRDVVLIVVQTVDL